VLTPGLGRWERVFRRYFGQECAHPRAIDAARPTPCPELVPVFVPSLISIAQLWRGLVWVACSLLAVPVVQAASPAEMGRPLLQSFTPRDYHGHNQVWAAVQDAAGVMWFGTASNVLSYDGAVWRHYPVPIEHARALGFSDDGRLYVSGSDTLGFLAPGPDGIPVYTSLLDSLPAELRPPGEAWSLAVVHNDAFFATDRQIMRWSDGHFRLWSTPVAHRQYLKFLDGTLWLHRRGEGLFRFDGEDFRLVSNVPEIVRSRFLALVPGGPGRLLVAADGGAFFRFENGQLEPFAAAVAPLLAHAQVISGVRLPGGGIALGTIAGGVFELDAAGALVRRLDEAAGLPNQGVISLAADREGGVWICTQNGIARAELAAPWSVYDKSNGLAGGPVLDLERHAGVLYGGTNAGLVRLVQADGVHGTAAHFEPAALPRVAVWSLLSHRSGLLVGADDGVHLFDGQNPPPFIPGPMMVVQHLIAARGSPDIVYVGCVDGVGRLHFDGTAWRDDGMVRSPASPFTLAEGEDGTVWIGTETRGFGRIEPAPAGGTWAQSRLVFFYHDHGLPVEPFSSRVLETPHGVLFSTYDGTFRFDTAADRFIVVPELIPPGLPATTGLWPMSAASDGSLWAEPNEYGAEKKSIGRLRPSGASRFDWNPLPNKLNDIVSSVGASGIVAEGRDRDAVVWVNGPDASIRVVVAADFPSPPPLSVVIRELTLPDGTLLSPQARRAPPRFAFSHAPLAFAYCSPHYSTGPGVNFQTRLRGFDESWSPWSPRTAVEFTNLSGGPFTFEVRAQDSDGRVSAPAAFVFSVAPPWRRSPLAYLLYALALVVAVYLFVRWRLARGERERLGLEALVAARTHDLAIARDAAESANRAKSAFLASMSHELRTPLNGVLGYAQLLQNDARLAPDQRERLRIVHQSGEHLLHMINDVLDLAKIEAGKLELRPAPFALPELVHDVAAAHAPAAAAKRLALNCELAADLPAWIEGDAQKLRQVLDNFLGNAVKFTASGSVTLRVTTQVSSSELRVPGLDHSELETRNSEPSPSGSGVTFAVIDTGPGISAGDFSRLFQPFEQARATRPAAPGTGLGLAISRALVETMGGTLAVASEPAVGSTFSFTLVLHASPAPAATVARPAVTGYEGPRRRVLIVDDHAVNRSLLADLLTPLGFECGETDSGAAALARLSDGTEPWPDLAILDLRMDGMDGLELTRRLRALPRGGELRVVLTSASVLSFDAPEARSAGCDDFLPKPFRSADLIDKIGTLLALRWHEVVPAKTNSVGPFASAAPIPAEARAALREVLGQGDLDVFRAALARVRAAHPAAGAKWDALDEAAAGFQLSRLRQLLEMP
jgi:signal transduction histidine kinase/CheY-like chemotaxis protein/ligand-binding sensor domain-containing protein